MKRHLVFLTFLVSLALQVVAHTAGAEDLNELQTTIQKLQDDNKALQEQLNKQREIGRTYLLGEG